MRRWRGEVPRLQPAEDKLLARYSAFVDDHATGFATPVLWHGVLRGVPWTLTEVARLATDPLIFRRIDPFRLSRRAWRLGDPTAAYNLAIDAFNRGNLAGYRHWLNRAAQSGATDALAQLKRFETRLPHATGPNGYRRPYRRAERN